MNIRYKIKYSDIYVFFYLFLLGILIFFTVINSSLFIEIIQIPGDIYLWCTIMTALLILMKKNRKKTFVLWVLVLLFAIAVFRESGSLFFLTLAVYWYGAQWVPYDKVLKSTLISLILGMLIVITANSLNAFPEVVFSRVDGTERMNFGFIHPNTFSLFLLAAIVCYYFLRDNHLNFLDVFPAFISFYIARDYADSKTVAAVLLLMVIFVLLRLILPAAYKYFKTKKKFWKAVCVTAIPFGTLLLLFITSRYSKLDWLTELGNTAAYRLYYANVALKRYGVNMFGNIVQTYGSSFFALNPDSTKEYFVIDCAYVYLLVRDGVVASLFVWGGILKSILRQIKQENLMGVYMMGLLLVYSLMETGLLNFSFMYIYLAGICVLRQRMIS